MTFPWAQLRLALLKTFTRFYLEVVIGSVLVVLAVGYLWFLRSGFEYLRTQGRYSLLEIQTQERYLEGYLGDLRRLKLQYDQLNLAQFERFTAILPPQPDYAGLFAQLQALAESTGMVLHGIQLAPNDVDASAAGAALSEVQSVQISITISGGSYQDLKRFLSDVESNLRLLDVTSITFSDVKVGPYSIQMRTYYVDSLPGVTAPPL